MADVTVTPTQVRPEIGSMTVLKTVASGVTGAQVGMVVCLDSDGNVVLADANAASTTTGWLAVIVAASRRDDDGDVIAGETVTCLTFGRVYLGESAALVEGSDYYLSDTAGGIADAAGTITRRIGTPESSTILFFNPNTVAVTS